ncbi:MAG: hypothetical protein JKX92_13300 [Porticoccaceae bacterium]|nr:hypothetical protein [Porticoccaceae bacterium]
MRLLKLLCKLITIILVGTLEMCWSAILFLIDFIDENDQPEYSPQNREGTDEIDYARHFNDVYDNHNSHNSYNDN